MNKFDRKIATRQVNIALITVQDDHVYPTADLAVFEVLAEDEPAVEADEWKALHSIAGLDQIRDLRRGALFLDDALLVIPLWYCWRSLGLLLYFVLLWLIGRAYDVMFWVDRVGQVAGWALNGWYGGLVIVFHEEVDDYE